MPINDFRPKSGRYGVQPVYTSKIVTETIVANDVTQIIMPVPGRKARFNRLIIQQGGTVAVDADGTILAVAYKGQVVSPTIDLTASYNLETGSVLQTYVADPASGLTEAERTFEAASSAGGDTLTVSVTSNSAAIDTQPVGLVFIAEFDLLE